MYCTSCGASQSLTAKFCTECGAPMVAVSHRSGRGKSGAVAAPTSKRAGWHDWRFAAVGAVVLVALAGLGAVVLSASGGTPNGPLAAPVPSDSLDPTASQEIAPPTNAPVVADPTDPNVAGSWSGELHQVQHGEGASGDYVEAMDYAATMNLTVAADGTVEGPYSDYQTTPGTKRNDQWFQTRGRWLNGSLELVGVPGTESLPPGDAFFMSAFKLELEGDQLKGTFYKPNGTYLGTADFTRS